MLVPVASVDPFSVLKGVTRMRRHQVNPPDPDVGPIRDDKYAFAALRYPKVSGIQELMGHLVSEVACLVDTSVAAHEAGG